jgi:hypothetical protein
MTESRNLHVEIYEQPEVEPQLGHLWQAPLRTISVPHSWHGGASVSWTHARSFTSTAIGVARLDLDREEVFCDQRDLRQIELRVARGEVALGEGVAFDRRLHRSPSPNE